MGGIPGESARGPGGSRGRGPPRNQPRLEAVRFDKAQGSAEFALVEVTGVGPKNPVHVEAFFVRLLDADRIELRFTFGRGPGRFGVEHIMPRRIRSG
jgi:hypothetical protein